MTNATPDEATLKAQKEAEEKARKEAEETAREEAALKKELADMKALNKDGKPIQPNVWQKHAPTWLGGWHSKKLEAVAKANAMANHYEAPNWWQRRMPTWLGGWSQKDVLAYQEHYRQKYGRPMRPNLWERIMPTELGGAPHQEVQAYDQFMDKKKYLSFKPHKPSLWDRWAPTILGGMSRQDLEKADALLAEWNQRNADNQEVFKGVTVGELKGRQFTEQQIEELKVRAQELRLAQIQKHAAGNELGIHDLTLQTTVNLNDFKLTKAQRKAIMDASKTDSGLTHRFRENGQKTPTDETPVTHSDPSKTR